MPSISFARENRLKSSFLIRRTFREGIKSRGRFISVFWHEQPEEKRIRFTVVVGSKVEKKAVVRNRMKRLMREALRKNIVHFPNMDKGFLVLLPHKIPKPLTLAGVGSELMECLSKFRR